MSIVVKEKEVRYHDSNFYRANPYANQGYIPTVSLKNRKQPQFSAEMPQGVQYFQHNSHKKFFTQLAAKSEITDGNLLANPEKYPLENTLANDINYHRNLNTIDIEGANVNSKKSIGVKNRIKAQEELMRRNAKIITPILVNGLSQQQFRRKLALQQLERLSSRQSQIKSKKRIYNSEKKLPPAQFFNKNPYLQKKDEGIQINWANNNTQKKDNQFDYKENDKLNIQIKKPGPSEKIVHYDSIDHLPKMQDSYKIGNDVNHFDRIDVNSSGSRMSGSIHSSQMSPELRQLYLKQRTNLEQDLVRRNLRNQHRLINPTNLSYEGSVIRNSGIFANLGKNIAIS